jgi:hypothetical protein
MTTLILNAGESPVTISEDHFLNAFRLASYSTPFDTAQTIVNQYKKFATEEELVALQELANSTVAQYLEG